MDGLRAKGFGRIGVGSFFFFSFFKFILFNPFLITTIVYSFILGVLAFFSFSFLTMLYKYQHGYGC